MTDRYYLNALGIVSSLGNSKAQVLQQLTKPSEQSLLSQSDEFSPGQPYYLGRVATQLPEIPEQLHAFNTRNNRLVLAALQQLNSEIDSLIRQHGHHRIGVVLGSSTSGINEGELALAHRSQHQAFPESFHYSMQEMADPAFFICKHLGLSGPSMTISTACSSSAKAMGTARRLLKMNLCDAVLVGGADSLCRLTVCGFAALESLSAGVCNPFSQHRDGINIGEGAALFIMSKTPSPIYFAGIGESSDAHHISAPDPEGKGAGTAMNNALQDAQLKPSDIDYINLHGTGTPHNDAMESRAVADVFGDHLPLSSSTKPLSGHTLGAAGAIEIAFCWLLLSATNAQQQLPLHTWDKAIDQNITELNLTSPTSRFTRKTHNYFMSNSFAFGGNNVTAVLAATGTAT